MTFAASPVKPAADGGNAAVANRDVGSASPGRPAAVDQKAAANENVVVHGTPLRIHCRARPSEAKAESPQSMLRDAHFRARLSA